MPRLGPVKRGDLAAVLRANGLAENTKQGKGGHTVFKHPLHHDRCTTVPPSKEIDTGLLCRIIKQSGKTREEYLERLLRLGGGSDHAETEVAPNASSAASSSR